MFSLQKLLGRDDVFFDLLEKSAEEARESVRLLVRLLGTPGSGGAALDEFALLRKKDKRITEELSTRLTQTFVTPLEREDIEALARGLYKIPKTAEKLAERFMLAAPHLPGVDFSKQAEMMLRATDVVLAMIKQLRAMEDLEKIKALNDKLQYIEGEADRFMIDALRELYSGRYEAIRAMVLRDVYELIEKVVDRCRDVGNVVMQIVLKNS